MDELLKKEMAAQEKLCERLEALGRGAEEWMIEARPRLDGDAYLVYHCASLAKPLYSLKAVLDLLPLPLPATSEPPSEPPSSSCDRNSFPTVPPEVRIPIPIPIPIPSSVPAAGVEEEEEEQDTEQDKWRFTKPPLTLSDLFALVEQHESVPVYRGGQAGVVWRRGNYLVFSVPENLSDFFDLVKALYNRVVPGQVAGANADEDVHAVDAVELVPEENAAEEGEPSSCRLCDFGGGHTTVWRGSINVFNVSVEVCVHEFIMPGASTSVPRLPTRLNVKEAKGEVVQHMLDANEEPHTAWLAKWCEHFYEQNSLWSDDYSLTLVHPDCRFRVPG